MWDYDVLTLEFENFKMVDLLPRLEELGREGWEAVTVDRDRKFSAVPSRVIPDTYYQHCTNITLVTLLLKRPSPPPSNKLDWSTSRKEF